MKYEVSPFNFVEGVLREWTVLTEFDATCPKLGGDCLCAYNLPTRKFGEINMF